MSQHNQRVTESEQLLAQRSSIGQAVLEQMGVPDTPCPPDTDPDQQIRYLAVALRADRPTLFTEYLRWARNLAKHKGRGQQAVADCLDAPLQTLHGVLSASGYTEALRFLERAVAESAAPLNSVSALNADESALADLARQYLAHLLDSDRRAASDLVMQAVDQGTAIRDIYLQVLQPVQRELGRLWQTNQINVAQEHFCTAATQMVMCRLYPLIFAVRKRGSVFVGTCTSGELHEIGIRMITDLLELEGWDTYFVGARTPSEDIVELMAHRKAHVLGISATLTTHIDEVRRLIRAVRNDPRTSGVRIMVGGYPFNLDSSLYRYVGADGHAVDAAEALVVAEQLVGSVQEARA